MAAERLTSVSPLALIGGSGGVIAVFAVPIG